MSAARTLYHLVRADFLERVRRHGFLVTLALAAWLGYTVNAGQFVLRLDRYRGVYNSAWIGGLMASVVTTMLTLFGFYVVKNSVDRDRATRVGQVLAATPLRRPAYTLAKALSNFLALALMVVVLAVAAVVMQVLHREVAQVELWPLLSPFLLIALPAMAITAALAVLFETVPFLAGSGGNAIYIGVWATSLSAAFFMSWDMQGVRLLWRSMGAACRAAYPDYQGGFDLGFGSRQVDQTFVWTGIHWTAPLVLERLLWVGLGLGVALLAAVFFDRFDPARRARRWGRGEGGAGAPGAAEEDGQPDARLEEPEAAASVAGAPVALAGAAAPAAGRVEDPGPRYRLGALLGAELRLLLARQPRWWQLVALALLVVGAALPPDTARRTVLVAAWIWPLAVWSSLGAREARHGLEEMVFSAAHPLARQLPASWLAGFVVAVAAGAGVAVRLALIGDGPAVLAFLSGAAFVPALALALGAWTGSQRPFEAVYTLLWYVGPLNQVPSLDYMGAWKESVAGGVYWAFLGLTPVLLAAAVAGRRRRLLA
ncbi:MAG TPA: hypothetical protein VMS93_05390 [Candidatus Saccharimonadales bacterium]|nr:hypothetical protein [Candidatus Saccharimonadales bacterium]